MKKVLTIIIYLVCGIIMTLASTLVRSEETIRSQFCWPSIITGVIGPNDCETYTRTHTKYGFPFKHEEFVHGSGPLSFDHRPPGFSPWKLYRREFALNIFFWAPIVAVLHYMAHTLRCIKTKIISHKNARQRMIIGKSNLSSGPR